VDGEAAPLHAGRGIAARGRASSGRGRCLAPDTARPHRPFCLWPIESAADAARASASTVGRVHTAEVGTEIAPLLDASSDASGLADRVDALLRRTCMLARTLTGAEQAALKLWVDEDPGQARKYFSLSAAYAEWRDYRPNPKGLGLHGLEIPPGEVIRLTQAEVEAHPAWRGFGDEAGKHPPFRGWLASAVCGEGDRRYGLLQLSDKRGGADFTEEDADAIRELAALVGETLDALRAAGR
jgi:hypothetical protein